jgi:hypothetical protein
MKRQDSFSPSSSSQDGADNEAIDAENILHQFDPYSNNNAAT